MHSSLPSLDYHVVDDLATVKRLPLGVRQQSNSSPCRTIDDHSDHLRHRPRLSLDYHSVNKLGLDISFTSTELDLSQPLNKATDKKPFNTVMERLEKQFFLTNLGLVIGNKTNLKK